MKFISSQQGVSLYLAFMLITILLATALGLSAIVFSQLKTMRSLGKSTVALGAADTGIERAMYVMKKQGILADLVGDVGQASYKVQPQYEGEETYIESVGIYKGVRRAVRVLLLEKGFPRIRNAVVLPTASGPEGTIFTIQADIAESEAGVNPDTVLAYIQRPDENDIVVGGIPLLLISGTALDGKYEGSWDSTGAADGAYLVDIWACSNTGNCRELENLETTVP